ncbi:MAG TPA: DNA mismatch repair protein MutS [Cyanobacteria bacterium UBA9971]|nr:DNA mismatch repair protein MutS [Cyanobacteria bacterium UBA9971]
MMSEEYLKSYEVDPNDATPMVKQYLDIKKDNQGVILFYRMGDFYEMFFEDAVIAAKDLELTLTGREGGKLGRIPMAGVPQKAADNYIARLLEKGHKVAICDQMEDASQAKGLVERKVVRTITAGTIIETNLLDASKNNYLASVIKPQKDSFYGLAYVDISTGEFKISKLTYHNLLAELNRISPSEIIGIVGKRQLKPFQIVPEETLDLPEGITNNYNCTVRSAIAFSAENALEKVKQVFDVNSLEGFGFPEYTQGLIAAGAIIDYLQETQKTDLPKLDVITPYNMDEFVSIDANTARNLELVQTVRDNNYKGSLFWSINRTKTNMGARLLRKWIQQPLQNIFEIKKRQDAVEEFIENSKTRLDLAFLLDKVYDIERLATKISNNSVNGRDFIALRDSLKLLPEFGKLLFNMKSPLLSCFSKINTGIADFVEIIDKTVDELPPVGIKEGNLIKPGVNKELDYLKSLLGDGKEWLSDFENKEKERTGIKSLKVGYSKNFGFFIEVTHSNTSLVPENYIRKQTLSNAERYITPELKKHENEILSAESKSIDMEYQIFCNFRDYSKEFVEPVRDLAKSIAVLDVLSSFAEVAAELNYVRPEINESSDIMIKDGRHPVIEQLLPLGSYVPNDLFISSICHSKYSCHLEQSGGRSVEHGLKSTFVNRTDSSASPKNDKKELQTNNTDVPMLMILTGPNMAGKSTFMRQNALILILAQIGSYVPAYHAEIGIIDKIFTRVGAVDDLSTGQSTFMVEMNETSYILNSATDRSFILLDEIGRGTGTYDGVAIAWSVAEYISQNIKARTIFATHYHELNIMCEKYPEIKNYRITISENDGEIEFIRRVVQGGASKSYGIHVAKMAGLPDSVVNRAQYLMNRMQKDYSAKISAKKKSSDEPDVDTPQLSLFVE